MFDGVVEQRKGVNFPGIELDLPSLTDQDKKDLELALLKKPTGLLCLL